MSAICLLLSLDSGAAAEPPGLGGVGPLQSLGCSSWGQTCAFHPGGDPGVQYREQNAPVCSMAAQRIWG